MALDFAEKWFLIIGAGWPTKQSQILRNGGILAPGRYSCFPLADGDCGGTRHRRVSAPGRHIVSRTSSRALRLGQDGVTAGDTERKENWNI